MDHQGRPPAIEPGPRRDWTRWISLFVILFVIIAFLACGGLVILNHHIYM